MGKLFSIISPCYNGENYLARFLDSVLMQTYQNIELILIDDASSDKTIEIANGYIDKFNARSFSLRILTQESNCGQAAAINKGLPYVNGDYFMWMDSDDLLLPTAIEEKVMFLEKNPNFDFVLNQGLVVSEDDLNSPISVLKRIKPEEEDNLFNDLIEEKNVVFGPGTIAVRTTSFKHAIPSGEIFESREGQNWQMMLPLAYLCKYGYIEKPLFKYIVRNDSHSHFYRDFSREIQRQDDIELLIINTIKKIPNMDSYEEEKWCYKTRLKVLKNKLRYCVYFRQRIEYKKYKRELNNLGCKIPIKDSYFLFPFKKIILKMINYIRRRNNK